MVRGEEEEAEEGGGFEMKKMLWRKAEGLGSKWRVRKGKWRVLEALTT